MQILIKYDKTYTIDIDPSCSLHQLATLIREKTGLAEDQQLLIHHGKALNIKHNIQPNDCFYLYPKLVGGNFVSTGNLIVSILISLGLYWIAYPIVFYGMELLVGNSTYQSLNTADESSSIWQRSFLWLQQLLHNNAIIKQNGKTIDGIFNENNQSTLLYLYLLVTLLFWFLYSSTVTMIFYSYFKCTHLKPSQRTLGLLVGIVVLVLALYPILFGLSSRWGFFQNYSVVVYTILVAIITVIYYLYTLKDYDFSFINYLFLTVLILFFYYQLMVMGGFSRFTLFAFLPIIGSVFYVLTYLMDYFTTFSETC